MGVVATGICGQGSTVYSGEYKSDLIPSEPWSVEWNDRMKWTLTSDGRLTITGDGRLASAVEMKYANGSFFTSPWCKYADRITELVIGSGVNLIGYNAFGGLYKLKTVWLPSTTNVFYENAFKGCNAIKDVYTEKSETGWQWLLDNKLIDTNSPLRKASIHYNATLPSTDVPQGGDEEEDLLQVVRILQYAVDLGDKPAGGDINKDNSVNAADAAAILTSISAEG